MQIARSLTRRLTHFSRRAASARRGFSLVELLVACVLFACGALALQAATLVVLRQARDARVQDFATTIAAGALERSVNLPCTNATDGTLEIGGVALEWESGPPSPAGARDVAQTVHFPRAAGARTDRFAGAVRCR